MKIFIVPFMAIFFSSAFAADKTEERAIANMLKGSSLSREEILEHYKTGCGSGIPFRMRIRAAYSFFEAAVELNDAYKKLIARLSKEKRADLIKASAHG